MRGVRALRQAPLVLVVALLSTCRLEFKLVEPSVEVDAQRAYQSGGSILIDYKFTADEPSLRCKYAVDTAGSIVQQGVTGTFPPGTWQQLSITLDPNPLQGEYSVQLAAQAPRGNEFVNLAFLTKSFAFYLDSTPPASPEFSPSGGLFNSSIEVALSHPEWGESPATGSPVSVYYTTDHTDPTATSSRYVVGSPINVPLSETPTEVRAIAIDEAGQQSAASSATFNFVDILFITCNTDPAPNVFYTGQTDQYVYLHGYGFSTGWQVEFLDPNSTPASTYVVPLGSTSTYLKVSVVLPVEAPLFTDNGTLNEGILRLKDGEKIIDQIAVDLRPGYK